MDTQNLINEVKARFAHNSAKHMLKEKFSNKLLVADQGGLWKADQGTITFLAASKNDELVLIDTFGMPFKVNRNALLEKLTDTYNTVMEAWHKEWVELETKR